MPTVGIKSDAPVPNFSRYTDFLIRLKLLRVQPLAPRTGLLSQPSNSAHFISGVIKSSFQYFLLQKFLNIVPTPRHLDPLDLLSTVRSAKYRVSTKLAFVVSVTVRSQCFTNITFGDEADEGFNSFLQKITTINR